MVVNQASVATGPVSGLGAAAGPGCQQLHGRQLLRCSRIGRGGIEERSRQGGLSAGAAVAAVKMGRQCSGTPAPVSAHHTSARERQGRERENTARNGSDLLETARGKEYYNG